jgi:hypothetical protein
VTELRKSPIAHRVQKYVRNHTIVRSHNRGKGEREQTKAIFDKYKTRSRVTLNHRINDYIAHTLPNTNIKFQWDNVGNTQKSSTDVWMSPKDFLSHVVPTFGISESSIKWFDENYVTGKEIMYSLTLSVRITDNQVTDHEGRHRAIWALRNGIERLPVHVVWYDNRGNMAGKSKAVIPKLISQGFYSKAQYGDRYGTHSFYSALDEYEGLPLVHFQSKK